MIVINRFQSAGGVVPPTLLGAEGFNGSSLTLTAGALRTQAAYCIVFQTEFGTGTAPTLPTGTGITFTSLGTSAATTSSQQACRVSYGAIPAAWNGVITGGAGTSRVSACVYNGVTSVEGYAAAWAEGTGAIFNFPAVTGLSVARTIGRFSVGVQNVDPPTPAGATNTVLTISAATAGGSTHRFADLNATAWSPAAGNDGGGLWNYSLNVAFTLNNP